MTLRERLLTGKVGPLARFAPLRGSMRRVRDHSDLENLRKAGLGFIINIRPDQSKLHLVHCESVEVMSTSFHTKVFVATAHEALEWMTSDSERRPWEHCGRCGGGSIV